MGKPRASRASAVEAIAPCCHSLVPLPPSAPRSLTEHPVLPGSSLFRQEGNPSVHTYRPQGSSQSLPATIAHAAACNPTNVTRDEPGTQRDDEAALRMGPERHPYLLHPAPPTPHGRLRLRGSLEGKATPPLSLPHLSDPVSSSALGALQRARRDAPAPRLRAQLHGPCQNTPPGGRHAG